jgi:hypothetical protein
LGVEGLTDRFQALITRILGAFAVFVAARELIGSDLSPALATIIPTPMTIDNVKLLAESFSFSGYARLEVSSMMPTVRSTSME